MRLREESIIMEVIKKYGIHICWGLMCIMAFCLLWSIYRFNILPLKIFIIVFIGIIIICFILNLMCSRKQKLKMRKIGLVLSLLLCFFIPYFNIKIVNKAHETVKAITNGDIKTTEISVLVRVDSKYIDIKDLDGKQFGILSNIDRDNTDFMLNRLNIIFSNDISKISYRDFKDEFSDLLLGKTDAIIVNEGMRDAFNIINKNFNEKTRVLFTLDRKEVLENLKANDIINDAFLVYISGIDTNGPVSKTSRSDVNMLATINPKRKEMLLVFIPRDYYVPLQCSNGNCETGAMDKLTHAGLYGIETSQQTIEKLFDLRINYNIRLNFDTLITMVNALDGIEITSDKEFVSQDCSYIIGKQHVDGKCALQFARERYSYASGDRHRGENQQQVIEAMLKKFTKANIIKHYESIMNAVQGMFQTNMSTDEMTALLQMQINDMANWKVTSISVDGSGDMLPTYSFGSQPLYVMHPNTNTIEKAKTLIRSIYDS